ncbi:MAG: peptidylprolyl isomerase [Rhodospirillales bacterium]|nr:peptidylprolyl isomerase [Rhodospirillales bacterium]
MRKFLVFSLVLLFGFAGPSGTASAQQFDKIAAVVNDEVISVFDLNSRLSLVIAGTQAKKQPEILRRLAPQILRQLIDETLQMQEAKRLGVRVTDADLERAFINIERQNKLKKGTLESHLASQGTDKMALIAKIEPEIAWVKVVGRRIRPQVQVGPEDIDEALARINAAAGAPEFFLYEIFLRVDAAENEKEVRQIARRIVQQLKSGAAFQALARNFSQSASASKGGDLGWVRQGELESELTEPVAKLKPGQFLGPVRTLGGYHILLLRDRRIAKGLKAPNATLELQQLFFPIAQGAPSDKADAEMVRARSFAARAENCESMEKLGAELGTGMSGSLGKVELADLPAPLRKAVETLEPGRPSEAVRTENGIIVLMVCSREDGGTGGTERERVEKMLIVQRVDAAARRYMRDLRRAAFIDIRL